MKILVVAIVQLVGWIRTQNLVVASHVVYYLLTTVTSIHRLTRFHLIAMLKIEYTIVRRVCQ